MVIAMIVMMVSMTAISGFVERHPTVKILALAFLLLIGVMLVAEGMGRHIEKGYIYFAMAFALFVEMLNMRYRRRDSPVALHRRFEPPGRKAPGLSETEERPGFPGVRRAPGAGGPVRGPPI